MKTKISIATILAVTVLFLAGCQSSSAASGSLSDPGATVLLTEAEARDIALKDAGFTVDSVTNLHIEKDVDDGITKYEVDFRQGDYEYDYEIDAQSGKVIGFDKDLEPVADTPKPTEPAPTEPKPTEPETTDPTPTEPKPTESAATKAITADEAKKIALNDAGFKESEVKRLTVKKDTDDGVTHYDVEFYKGDYEYDYEINAKTGKITDYSKEKEATKASATTPTTKPADTKTISKSEAKKIALNHAGLKESEVTALKVELDKDDGVTYYDVEFRKGIYEYSYEINAKTGKIIEWDKDIDD